MIWLWILVFVGFSLQISTLILMRRNMVRFQRYMLSSRNYQLLALEALHSGDMKRADVLMAAAQEQLDRAKFYVN